MRLAVLTASALSLAACGETTYEQLASSPEAQLYFPGSKVVAKTGQGESSGIDSGRSLAYVHVELTSDQGMDAIYAWYKAHLLAEGWQLRETQTPNYSRYGFSKGDRQIFLVTAEGTSESKTKYSIDYSLRPDACATDPPPLNFANC